MARGAFWTIIVDEQPTAFRAPVREDLLPTLKQLQRQHPGAVIKWFQRGRLWETPGDAMDAGRPPRRGADWRPGGEHKDPRAQYQVPRDVKRKRWAAQAAEGRGPWVKGADRAAGGSRPPGDRPAWRPKPEGERAAGGDRPRSSRPPGDKPAWRPKPDGDRPRSSRPPGDKPAWRPKPEGDRGTGGDRPRSSRPPGDKPAWRPKPDGDRASGGDRPRSSRPAGDRPAWRPKPDGDRAASSDRPRSSRPPGDKPAWRPKADASRPPREGKTGWKPSGDARPRGGDQQRGAPRADWRGDRGARRDAAARPAGDKAAPAAAKKKTWRAGQLPPADRKRKKDVE